MKNIRYYKTLNNYIDQNINIKNAEFLLVAQNCDFDIKKLQKSGIQFVGAIVPQVIINEFNCEDGLLAVELHKDSNSLLIEDINSFDIKKEELVNMKSLTIMIDGLSKSITPFLESIFNLLPNNAQIIGAGAGKTSLKQEPVIFSNVGIFEDAALLLATNSNLLVDTASGWEFLAGPFVATSTEKNTLKSINFKNPFEVFKEVVENDSGDCFDKNNFYNIVKSYPLGVVKFDNEILVKEFKSKNENGNIVLVGDIEQNSTINILKGDKKSLITSTENTMKNILSNKNLEEVESVILFNCITRYTFLEDSFKKELKVIKNSVKNKDIFGALTLGEIINNGNEYVNFNNKTCVVGVLC